MRRIRSRTGAVERSLEAEALALERPRETQLRHIAGGADLAAAARAREGVLEEWERGEGRGERRWRKTRRRRGEVGR